MGVPRPHIPYRNSLMTMVLRDSLGGNCATTMVANVSPAPEFLDESISTCRFAQRVAMVANTVGVNQETDPALVIRRLRHEVRDLKAQLRLFEVRPAEACARGLATCRALRACASAGMTRSRSRAAAARWWTARKRRWIDTAA